MERLREDKTGREDGDKERKSEGEKGGIMRFINRVEEVVKVGDGFWRVTARERALNKKNLIQQMVRLFGEKSSLTDSFCTLLRMRPRSWTSVELQNGINPVQNKTRSPVRDQTNKTHFYTFFLQ